MKEAVDDEEGFLEDVPVRSIELDDILAGMVSTLSLPITQALVIQKRGNEGVEAADEMRR